MCFSPDSVPPIPPVTGGAIGHRDVTLTAADGSHFAVLIASPEQSEGPGIVILPDVRGLYRFAEELALRFAEHGYDAVAIDYFGRTAGVGRRGDDFPYMEHVHKTTAAGVTADTGAAVELLRSEAPGLPVLTIGSCFGGSNSWHQAAIGHGLAGAIGFHGHPNRELPLGAPPLVARAGEIACPILGLMGGDDPGIPENEVQAFRDALAAADVEHEIVTYPGAPHSFFDRRYEEFAAGAADARRRVLDFLAAHGRASAAGR